MKSIDKNLYIQLKKWCTSDKNIRPENQQILYVNSHDHALTDATVRKLMFEIEQENVYGEEYISYYSAPSFYRNMRDYFYGISRSYMKEPDDNDGLMDIIEDLPPSCGWITLIIRDIDKLSEFPDKIQEMMMTVNSIACNKARIIVIGDKDYKDVFRENEYALNLFTEGLNASEKDERIKIGYLEQAIKPVQDNIAFESIEKQRIELTYYWNILNDQLEHGCFEYDYYKDLFKETLEYIIPRISKEKIYRKDFKLIENIGAIRRIKNDGIDGCRPWEFEASKKYATGLYDAITNIHDNYSAFSRDNIKIYYRVEERINNHGKMLYGSGSYSKVINVDTVCQEIDELSKTISIFTYGRDISQGLE